jgi:hypothetical protein
MTWIPGISGRSLLKVQDSGSKSNKTFLSRYMNTSPKEKIQFTKPDSVEIQPQNKESKASPNRTSHDSSRQDKN